MENKEKKVIAPKDAIRGLINGFISYGILLMFIFLAIVVLIVWLVNNNRLNVNYDTLKYSLPLIGAFLIFFLIRGICKLSSFDVFKKSRIEEKDIDIVHGRMNLFYICLVGFSVLIIVVYLLTRFYNMSSEITSYKQSLYLSNYNEEYVDYLIDQKITEYSEQKSDIIISTTIIEMGLFLGIFSLIPAQKKLIEKYN